MKLKLRLYYDEDQQDETGIKREFDNFNEFLEWAKNIEEHEPAYVFVFFNALPLKT